MYEQSLEPKNRTSTVIVMQPEVDKYRRSASGRNSQVRDSTYIISTDHTDGEYSKYKFANISK